ncbi:hypothetical protein Droror1_Dr00004507, partial [Drosera rotundifolia]
MGKNRKMDLVFSTPISLDSAASQLKDGASLGGFNEVGIGFCRGVEKKEVEEKKGG